MKQQYVKTTDAKDAVKGNEDRILDAVVPGWRNGNPHIDCPYPGHGGKDDWRWDCKKAKAFCTCTPKADGIFDVVRKCEGLADFDETKIRCVELIGRSDLVRTKAAKGNRIQKTDPASLLNPDADNRDDALPRRYLAARLGIAPDDVLTPSTCVVGIKELAYFDPPPKGSRKNAKPSKVGEFPCAVFGTVEQTAEHTRIASILRQTAPGKPIWAPRAMGPPATRKRAPKHPDGHWLNSGMRCVLGRPDASAVSHRWRGD